jgi:O-antigen/teichoic acid export membrane protein/SAM-dependent methyltransferase
MTIEAQATVRNAGLLVVQRGLLVVGGFIFAALIPRLLGPELYGQYALITSLAIWFVLISALGLTEVIGRYMPQFILRGEMDGLRRLLGNLLAMRLASGALSAGIYLLLMALWLHDLDPVVLALAAATVFIRSVANFLYTISLGLNRAARWGSAEVVRQWSTLILLPTGFVLGGFRGAFLGLLLVELTALSVGFWGVRSYVPWPSLRPSGSQLGPYLRFGLFFYASNLIQNTFQRSGEALVRIASGDYAQVGYFGLAYSIFLTIAVGAPQLALAFAPLLTMLRAQGQTEALRRWIERLLKWLAVGGMMAVFGALFLSDDLVPIVLGQVYRPVATNLIPLAVAFLPLTLSSTASLLALVYDRPRIALEAAGLRLAAFWVLGVPFVAAWGSLGGCLAMLVSYLLYAGYFTWRMQRVVRYSLRGWLMVIGSGVLFLPLALLRSSWTIDLALFGLCLAGYGGLLLLLRVVTLEEVIAISGRRSPAARGSGYWSGVARQMAAQSHYLDPFLGTMKRQAHLDLIERWGGVPATGRLLKTDLFEEAMGPDAFLWDLAGDQNMVVGIDLSIAITARAQQRDVGQRTRCVVADNRHLPFADGAFALIVSPSTLDHFADPADLGRSLCELSRVLEPGGRLIITLDNRQNILDPLLRLVTRLGLMPYYIGRSYRAKELHAELEAAGLTVQAGTAILHNPRLLATTAVAVANRLHWPPLIRLVRQTLIAAQRLENTPWRYRTGSFVAAAATKRRAESASD